MNEPNFLRVPYAQSVHGQDEIDAVLEVLKTSTQMGEKVSLMEEKVAQMFEKKFGIMTNSGTSSLMLAAEAANLPEDSEVITAAFTWISCVYDDWPDYIHHFSPAHHSCGTYHRILPCSLKKCRSWTHP